MKQLNKEFIGLGEEEFRELVLFYRMTGRPIPAYAVARFFGVSRKTLYNIEQRAMKKLREAAEPLRSEL